MNTVQWQTAWRILNAARELPLDEQRQFVESQSADPEIVQRVFDGLEEIRSVEEQAGLEEPTPHSDRSGALVGRYSVTSLLGRGGTGEVYSAEDTDLGRAVALKFLRPEAIGDSASVKRFVREAKAASALNHPNIVTIHEVIDSTTGLAIVMELVAGKPLNELRGMNPTHSEVIQIGTQVAAALAAAHTQGIVHRDIKPENLILRPDGLVKVLDFGLARNFGGKPASTLQSSITDFAGTPRYMSPEQLRGERLTGASDVYSLGLVLYELIAGHHPFESSYPWETAHAIHSRAAQPLAEANREIPEWLSELVAAMLNRDAALRPSARDVELALSQERGGPRSVQAYKRFWKPAVAALIAVAAATLVWLVLRTRPLSEAAPIAFTQYPGDEDTPSFSPDGQSVAFAWNGPGQDNFDIYIRDIGSPSLQRVTTSPLQDDSPAWSPDGKSIAFLRKGTNGDLATLFIVPAQGGPEREVAKISFDLREPVASLAWTPDGKWVIAPEEREPAGLFLISPVDGTKKRLTRPATHQTDFAPAITPDGRMLAFVRSYAEGVPSIHFLPLAASFLPGGEPQQLPAFYDVGLATPQWTADGKDLLFVANPQATGMAIWRTRAPEPGKSSETPRVVSAIRSFKVRLGAPSAAKRRLMYSTEVQDRNIWLTPLRVPEGTSQPKRIATASQNNSGARISPDGKRIVYQSFQTGFSEIWASNLDGTDTVQLTNLNGIETGSPTWAPDGKRIAFDSRTEGRPHIYIVPSAGGRPERLTDGLVDNYLPAWSSDGHWIYYCSTRSGTVEVWRQPASGGAAEQITQHGGWAPTESPDGRSLYYQRKVPTGWSLRERILATGVDREILPVMIERAFALASDGVYYIPAPGPDGRFTIQFHSFESKASRSVTRIYKPMVRPLSLAPDGSFLLYSQLDRSGKDLMLLEHFY